MPPLPYAIASKIAPRLKASEAYAKGLIQKYVDKFKFFASLTPRGKVKLSTLHKRGRRLIHSLNVQCFGRNYLNRGEGLVCMFIVEDRDAKGNRVRPHLHLLIQDHPMLTAQVIIDTWLRISKGAIENAQGVRLIHGLPQSEAYISYVCKWVGWTREREPFIFEPKCLTKEAQLDVFLNRQHTSGALLRKGQGNLLPETN